MDDHKAIDAALDLRWQDALKLNKKIIKVDPQNVDALNRQARVYMELSKFNLAKKYYSQVLKIDPYNSIAVKNLKIIKSFKFNGQNFTPNGQDGQAKLSPSLFLQEPGKTKIVNLLKVAEPQKLSHLFCGMKVGMIIKNRKIAILDTNGDYLGVLPDDTCHLMLRLLKGGNKYDLFIKSIKVNGLSVLIKETFRSRRFKNQSSFLAISETILTTQMYPSLEDQNETNEKDVEESEEEPV